MVDTRREIAEIVREVANAVRSNRSSTEFFSLLADRTLRAMAAEGVVFWRRSEHTDSLAYRCVHRLGRVTDQTLPTASRPAHERLLVEIGRSGAPAVVPSTPGASDPDFPSNPADVPTALVPIHCDASQSDADYLFQVFLEPGGGVATQRGYLRFVVQMADLAGEYLRAEQLRSLLARQRLATQVDEATSKMHALTGAEELAEFIADSAVDVFGFDRVGIVRLDGPSPKRSPSLIAVSHVPSIDQRSSAADQVRRAATTPVDADGSRWFDAGSQPPQKQNVESNSIVVRVVAGQPDDHTGKYRIVGLSQTKKESLDVDAIRDSVTRFATHCDLAMQNVVRTEQSSSRWLPKFISADRTSTSVRRAFKVGGVCLVLATVAAIPVPLVVDAPAIVRPADSQMVCATRDAVVQSIAVAHGQAVKRGQVLLTMSDPSLDDQILALDGNLAVLSEKRNRLNDAMMKVSVSGQDRAQSIQNERLIVSGEIQSITDQRDALRRTRESLAVHADRDGIVDAWQVESRLQSRPVNRGDGLMRVIAADSGWIVEARVPQNRIAQLKPLLENSSAIDRAHVSFDSDPGHVIAASLIQLGPSVVAENDPLPATAAMLRLEDVASDEIRNQTTCGDVAGAPARVMFKCGYRPIVYVMFQDLIHSIRSTASLYFFGHRTNTGDAA
ncbi:hypothetical protein Poly51_33570 [Rubripirellula tenax]|uniref:Uncharacterized protein n=1 Tax=Rubripirellula tenax TaxID=2528015 RepID=A0A5C6EZT7_9BACT|nr:hypothetical protein Poly51_33570 [Rubripirellula tenax]